MELYALSSVRSADRAYEFLRAFVPDWVPCTDEFSIPELGYPKTQTFQDVPEILYYLETHETERYGLYFGNKVPHADIETGMLFFTEDGGMILGLAMFSGLLVGRNKKKFRGYIEPLWKLAGTEHIWVTSEQRPPDKTSEFVALCKIPLSWEDLS